MKRTTGKDKLCINLLFSVLSALYLLSTWSSLGEESKGEELWVLGRKEQTDISTKTFPSTQYVYSAIFCLRVMCIVFMLAMFVYLDEQVASTTELDQEPENQASKHHLDNAPHTSYSCICSILNLNNENKHYKNNILALLPSILIINCPNKV